MQIKKEVTFDITAKEANEFLKECLNDKDKLSEFVDGMNLGVMSYIAAKYVNRLAKDDPYSYEKFVEFLPKPDIAGIVKESEGIEHKYSKTIPIPTKVEEKQETKKVDVKKSTSTKPKFHVGDSFKCNKVLAEELSSNAMLFFVAYWITVTHVTEDPEQMLYTMKSNFGEIFYVTEAKLLKWMKEEKIIGYKQVNVWIH
jgi:hypothetical protein